ncbi:MAG: DNA/RNA nuclease SfsA [Anaerovoracaceae bacterium]
MKYNNICKGKFIERPNRFVAYVEIEGKREKVHVKNTGRCRELLIPGAEVYLEDFSGCMGTRKLRYSLVSVEKNVNGERILVNMDSQAPNKVVREALESKELIFESFPDITAVVSEKVYGNSRFDFYMENVEGKKAFLEVKGVTLEESNIALFPDAPTERGVKHIEELIKAKDEGFWAGIVFIIQMKGISLFKPNWETHKNFAYSLKKAEERGVYICAYDCFVTDKTLKIDHNIKIDLTEI